MTFEKTALLEKSTFQPPLNVCEFGLWSLGNLCEQYNPSLVRSLTVSSKHFKKSQQERKRVVFIESHQMCVINLTSEDSFVSVILTLVRLSPGTGFLCHSKMEKRSLSFYDLSIF
jgi:hypothetical protein